MTGSPRKLALIAAAVAALIVAATAGAIVKDTIFTIPKGQLAHLAGTNVYCAHTVNSHKQRAFLCIVYGGKIIRGSRTPSPSTYAALVGPAGMEIGRWSANGKTVSTLRKFNNP